MQCKQEGARLQQQPNAQPQKGAINIPDDTSIVRQAWHLVKLCAILISAAFWGLLVATWALPAAWAERGTRSGIGGEWLLILAATWFGGWLCCKMINDNEEV